jgi:hypothetical protein
MKKVLRIVSFLALGGTLGAALAFFYDVLPLASTKGLLLACAVIWFASAPFWMEHKATD